MKLVLTQECGDILLINPDSKLVTNIDSIDKRELKEKYRNIYVIDHRVKLDSFVSVFCMMIPKGIDITTDNIDNEKIALYTFTDDSNDLKMDVSKMRVQNTPHTIATHFLRLVSTNKHGSNDYKKYIKDHYELELEINDNCRRKMELDMRAFKEANEICINDTCERSLCHSFAKRMILQAKHRFDDVERDEITELPFQKHDYIYYKYICSYQDIIQVYMIRIILV